MKKCQAPIKLAQPFPVPELRGGNFMDTPLYSDSCVALRGFSLRGFWALAEAITYGERQFSETLWARVICRSAIAVRQWGVNFRRVCKGWVFKTVVRVWFT